jgi:hypothetical protein
MQAMVGGPLMLLRQSLQSAQYARPWLQVVIALALIAGGIGLAIVGVPRGGVVAAAVGCMFFVKKAQLWVARRRSRASLD